MARATLKRGEAAERIWRFLRKSSSIFTANDLARITGVSLYVCRYYLRFLARAGYLRVVGIKRSTKEKIYEVKKLTGNKPVTIDHNVYRLTDHNTGSRRKIQKGNAEETARSKILAHIEKLSGDFSPKEVSQATGVNYKTTANFIRKLYKEGFLEQTSRRPARYKHYKEKTQMVR
jgi:response regulator of citrate/malate metabolism